MQPLLFAYLRRSTSALFNWQPSPTRPFFFVSFLLRLRFGKETMALECAAAIIRSFPSPLGFPEPTSRMGCLCSSLARPFSRSACDDEFTDPQRSIWWVGSSRTRRSGKRWEKRTARCYVTFFLRPVNFQRAICTSQLLRVYVEISIAVLCSSC